MRLSRKTIQLMLHKLKIKLMKHLIQAHIVQIVTRNWNYRFQEQALHTLKCLFYDKRDDLIQISKDVIINTFVDQGIFIPAGARCCEGHITEQSIFEDRSKMKITSNETELNSEEIKGLLSDSEKESWLRFWWSYGSEWRWLLQPFGNHKRAV